ncbi:MAG: hypothetical protein ACOC9E_05465, partial [Chloroflexota bacterium]
MVRAGIIGASGYTGAELVRLLAGHPNVEMEFATSESNAGAALTDLHLAAPAMELIA